MDICENRNQYPCELSNLLHFRKNGHRDGVNVNLLPAWLLMVLVVQLKLLGYAEWVVVKACGYINHQNKKCYSELATIQGLPKMAIV